MTEYFNDSPIESPDEDRFGVTPFAESLARSILNIRNPVGTTIALNGAWGSGKSSVVNLLRRELETAGEATLVVSDFKCWWYRGEEALALAFFQNLNTILKDKLGDKVKGMVPKLGRSLLQAGPVIGAAVAMATTGPVGALVAGTAGFAKRFFPDEETLETTFRKLAKILEDEDRRFLIIIDDIDRLSPEEALAIFRLVKSVGKLPNVLYLLVFDRALADQAVAERYPSEGPHYLEKIIQAGFEIPDPLPTDLHHAALSAIQEVCGPIEEDQVSRLMNVFYDVVAPYLSTPRHVGRFRNAISVTWPAIAHEVSTADFIALETLRLYEPALFKTIRSRKKEVCGVSERGTARDDPRFDVLLAGVSEARKETGKLVLQSLFPRLEHSGYSGGFRALWDAERRVCIEPHFDTYFRLSLSEDLLSAERVAALIERADDREFVQTALRDAVQVRRRNGSSHVPVVLDTLTTHARRIEKTKAAAFLAAIFEVHDEINLQCDDAQGFGAFGGSSLRYHWLIRQLTADRYTLDERTTLYAEALQGASLGWLVDFVKSAMGHYGEREDGPKPEDQCLVSEAAIPSLVSLALARIRAAAEEGTLYPRRDTVSILYRWRDFAGNADEPRAWTDRLMADDEALVFLAQEFTGESTSIGLNPGGLGDRVAMRRATAQISEDIEIIDLAAFRSGLERIRDAAEMDAEKLGIVRTFLNAWDERRRSHEA